MNISELNKRFSELNEWNPEEQQNTVGEVIELLGHIEEQMYNYTEDILVAIERLESRIARLEERS